MKNRQMEPCLRHTLAAVGRTAGGGCLALLLSACASGPAFLAIEPPRDGEALVYLYRETGIRAAASSFDVVLDGQAMGELKNGAFLRLVYRGPAAFVALQVRGCEALKRGLALRPGETAFVQAEIVHGMQAVGGQAAFLNSCRLQRRGEADALPVLQGLRRSD
nr:hypothetical protein [uncultured Roseateles sp.]